MEQNFQINPSLKNLDPASESDRLLAEVGKVMLAAKEQPKDEMLDFLLRELPEGLLMRILDSITAKGRAEEDHPAVAPFIMAAIFLRSELHGDKKGRVAATEDEIIEIVNTLNPYLIIEFLRRRQCFGVVDLPKSPWVYNAVVRVAELNVPKITQAVAELEELKLPYPPILTDKDVLREMEENGAGIEIPMPVRGTPVATEEMLNIQPQKLPPLDPQKFADAVREVNQVAFTPERRPALDIPEVDLFKKSGQVERLNGADSPQIRAVQVFNKHFDEGLEQAQSALVRFFALNTLLSKNTLVDWVQNTPEWIGLHPAILDAAATVGLTKGGSFPPARFLKEVERLAEQY